ncbi:MAG: sulfotransferase, partial [Planctomycetes bacterium]|nr:sulfotransferase [Planctomycetota bacterium]
MNGSIAHAMATKTIVFIGGLHRSGTSLIHQILREHRRVSGFGGTGVPEDEGQHLQTLYPPARDFGGPGRFGFDPRSFMDEHHPLVSESNALRLFEQWSRYWDLDKQYLIEKSPPNLVRTRFLQALFPNCGFLILLR